MAPIPFNAVCRRMHVLEQLKSALSAFGDTLDALASNRMRHAVAETEHVRQRQNRNVRDGRRDDQSEQSAVWFDLPLDVLSDAIPAFFIGRNKAGLWVAREARGRIGGLFLLKSSAVAFARARSEVDGCATIFPDDTFELDVANEGNPLALHLGWLARLVGGLGTAHDGPAASIDFRVF